MKRLQVRLWLIPLLVIAIAAGGVLGPAPGRVSSAPLRNNVLQRALDIELGRVQPAPYEQLLSSGVMYDLLGATGELNRRVAAVSPNAALRDVAGELSRAFTQGCQNVFHGHGQTNTRVNQDCSLRRQAEEVIAINPNDPNNLIAGQNDSRIGFNHCGYDWSFDGGRTWGDQVPPFWQFVMADDHTADACSDPTATFDAESNAYVGGVLFDVASAASAFVVAKSNAGIGGAFYHSPAPGAFQEYLTDPLGVVASDNDPNIFHDKEFIVADNHPGSPKANNVYATWTRFNADTGAGVGGNSPIYFSQSTDGGATWSPGIEISGANAAVCAIFSGSANPNACDQDQGSHPIVGRDGTVYVAFGNGNTPDLGFNQVLMVKCPAAADCSNPASWTAPVKVGDLIGIHPFGPSAAGCPAGRQCLPPNGYRVPEFTSISISADSSNKLYVSWSDARNLGANCNPLGSAATATPPCDNDVFYAFSTNGGATWSATRKITPAGSAQWQPWSAVTSDGKALWVAYYDRAYGNCESTGCNDITLAKIRNAASNNPSFSYERITTASMPNLIPTNNPAQAGFLGDYMWVAVDRQGRPYIVWADTRGLRGTVEEDIYFAKGPKP
ncbi:MAG TPA: sialidase family protein [Anaerolineae bacterium]|nr:sialidase family protein [Anaerolineae bacterium]